MIKDEQLKILLDSVIFDLESVLNSTKEKYTYNTLNTLIKSLNAIKSDTQNKEYKNLIKRMLYNRMTAIKEIDKQKSLEIYKIYQQLKTDKITPDEAIESIKLLEKTTT